MRLTEYQRRFIISQRVKSNQEKGVTLWTLTKTLSDANDIYAAETITSSSRIFSGSVAWVTHEERTDSSGGYYPKSDVTITCSLDEKSFVETENSYFVVDQINVTARRTSESYNTNELLIYCERLRD